MNSEGRFAPRTSRTRQPSVLTDALRDAFVRTQSRRRSVPKCCPVLLWAGTAHAFLLRPFYGVDLGRVDLGTVGLTIRPTENPSAAFVWLRGNFVDGELFDTGLAVHC